MDLKDYYQSGEDLTEAIKDLNVTLSRAPMGPAGLQTAGKGVTTHPLMAGKSSASGLKEIFDKMMASTIGKGFKSMFQYWGNEFMGMLKGAFGKAWGHISGAVDSILGDIKSTFIMPALDLIQGAWGFMKGTFSAFKVGMGTPEEEQVKLLTKITGFWKKLFKHLRLKESRGRLKKTGGIMETVMGWFKMIGLAVGGVIAAGLGGIELGKWLNEKFGLSDKLANVFMMVENWFTSIGDWFGEKIDSIKNTWKKGIDKIGWFFVSIANFFTSIPSMIRSALLNVISKIPDGLMTTPIKKAATKSVTAIFGADKPGTAPYSEAFTENKRLERESTNAAVTGAVKDMSGKVGKSIEGLAISNAAVNTSQSVVAPNIQNNYPQDTKTADPEFAEYAYYGA